MESFECHRGRWEVNVEEKNEESGEEEKGKGKEKVRTPTPKNKNKIYPSVFILDK